MTEDEYQVGKQHVHGLFTLFSEHEGQDSRVSLYIEDIESRTPSPSARLRALVALLSDGVNHGNWPWSHNAPPLAKRTPYGPREPR